MNKKKVREEMQNFLEKLDAKPKIEEILSQETVSKKKEPVFEEKHAEYFEGQLQLRKVNQEVLDYIHKRFHETRAQIPTQKIHSDGNIDYWVSSRKLLHKLAKELKNKFGGFTKESEQLFSFDHLTSKNIYRLNVYYEMHEYLIGDILLLEGHDEPFLVTGYKGERLVLQHVLTGKKTLSKLADVESKISRHKSKVVALHPEVQIMDTNFQPVPLEIPPGITVTEEENVIVTCNKNRWFFIKS